ncbi:MAG: molybdopterin-synthase adenylyltransferase MoeB [Gemmatimonadota bacterium]|nr:MAG: molybdopterin-synthase adenylyltransferase MoeB [Gemmatimonadota bacterium]
MARIVIRIPTPLRPLVEGRSGVEVEAGSAREALARLLESNERLRAQLVGDDGELRSYVNVYVGKDNLRDLVEDPELEDGAELSIVPSIAGGGDVGLTADELKRYSRHLLIPEVGLEGQERLKQARVLLIGAGGLGSPLALYLTAAGVGTIGVVDHDEVDLTNLQRQILYDTASVGTSKLRSAAARLRAMNPEVQIRTFETRLESSNALEILDGWDVVADGSDNFPTRYLVNDAAVLLGVPTVYGAIFRFEGQVSVFGAAEGPCYRCLFREPPPPELAPSCAEAGVFGVLPGIVGTIQATEAIKLILGQGRPLVGRLLLIDALRMTFRELSIRRDPDCPVCGESPTITELIDYEEFCGVRPEPDAAASSVPEIDVLELRRWLEQGRAFQLIDVREPYEWQICNLEPQGARLTPMDRLPSLLGELDSGRPLVIYCRTGVRSAHVVDALRAAGFEAVNLKGGIVAWAEAFDPEMPVY